MGIRSLTVVACALAAVTCQPPEAPRGAVAPRASAAASETVPVTNVEAVNVKAPTWPVPPEQKLPWVAPSSSVPAPIVEAATKLFAQGMADPRGCAWHEIDLEVASVWGGRETVTTRGWVLPGTGATRYAVSTSGLVYRVKRVGPPADLHADVTTALVPKPDDHRGFRRGGEAADVSTAPGPIFALMLLRVGERDLASKTWATQQGALGGRDEDPYVALAGTWLWHLFDRAVVAHMHADDENALESVRMLVAVHPRVEAEIERRAPRPDAGASEKKEGPRIDFLSVLPELARDQERRATRKSALPEGPTPESKAAALVERLDEVAARQMGQPGGVDLASDPIVQRLIELGTPAVPHLLRAIESDMRLTRSVHFWRDFSRHRTVLGVHEAAYVAIASILDVSMFDPSSTGDNLTARGTEGRKTLATALRTYWEKWKDVSPEEKWLTILSDDKETPKHWLDAASLLVEPSNVKRHQSSMVFTSKWVTSGGNAAMRGEPLRARTNPSVTDVMVRRVGQLSKQEEACAMALDLAAWDLRAAQKPLADLARQLAPSGDVHLASCHAAITLRRVEAKDATALGDYADFMTKLTPPAESWGIGRIFEPMVKNPIDPAVVRASNAVFGGRSAWIPFATIEGAIGPDSFARSQRIELVEGDLFKVAAFKAHVLAALADKRKVKTVSIEKGMMVTRTGNSTSSEGIDTANGPVPADGTKITLRVADHYAHGIARHRHARGAPAFALHWPDAERDRAIAAIRAYVEKL